LLDSRDNRLLQLQHGAELARVYLDSGYGSVMTNTHGVNAQCLQCLFRSSDLGKVFSADWLTIGNAGGQARCSRFIPIGQIQVASQLSDLFFCESDLLKRTPNAMFPGGASPRAVVLQIVSIGAIQKPLESPFVGVIGESFEHNSSAEIAAVWCVGLEVWIIHFIGGNEHVFDLHCSCQRLCACKLGSWQCVGYGSDSHQVAADCVSRHSQQQCAVDPTRECYGDTAEIDELSFQLFKFVVDVCIQCHCVRHYATS